MIERLRSPWAARPTASDLRLSCFRRDDVGVSRSSRCGDIREFIIAMRSNRFDKTAVENAIERLRGILLRAADDVEPQSADVDGWSHPRLIPPLIWRVREIIVFVVRPCNNVAFVDFLLEIVQQRLGSTCLKEKCHVPVLSGAWRPEQ